jgi:hypothetical protein
MEGYRNRPVKKNLDRILAGTHQVGLHEEEISNGTFLSYCTLYVNNTASLTEVFFAYAHMHPMAD